jgi:hypothetical protein
MNITRGTLWWPTSTPPPLPTHVPLGLFLNIYSAAILYFLQMCLAEYNTKKVAFFGLFGFL